MGAIWHLSGFIEAFDMNGATWEIISYIGEGRSENMDWR